ncbi:MAG: 5'-nucleotidase C-terminal domain-containing protein [Hyphomicrobiaceae bacterium]|nr:5'-nucleotidase C-terminal domain-containing protein [Hyphomicrobiaceae bacterium]MCC0024082.1 5'-nucleotidase C-terminal domain-containing protein [Hyphomicrobiaceae bacterium]
MTNKLKALLLGSVAFASVATTAARAEEVKLTLLLVSDLYEMAVDNARGGFSRAAAVARDERANDENVLYIHAGDAISPSLFSGFDKGEHVIELLNMEPPDIFVPGNHEYDFGKDVFMQRMADLKSEKLAANLRNSDGSVIPGFADNEMFDFNGLKVGVIGLTAEDSPVKSSPGDLQITGTMQALEAQSALMREAGADLVVAVAHAGVKLDEEMLNSGLADIILSGDDHTLHIYDIGTSILAEAQSDAYKMVALDIDAIIEGTGEDRDFSWGVEYRIIDTAGYAVPSDYAEKVASLQGELDKELDVPVGIVTTPLDSRRAMVRTQETAIGNLIADAMRDAVQADVAITNGGGIRADREYDANYQLTRKEVLTELPFGNLTLKIEVTGADIIAALENGLQAAPEAIGRFPQVSGLTVVYDPAKEPGSRVVSVKVGDADLDPNATYSLATNDYMARGGDGYSMFVGKPVLFSMTDAKLMANDVMAYIRKMGSVSPTVEGRISAGM